MSIEFDQIQGNILGGFNKDHQINLFLKVTNAAAARAALKVGDETSVLAHVEASSSKKVLSFNDQFRALHGQKVPEGTIVATWTNIVFTESGMTAFGRDLTDFPQAFKDRIEGRPIGDVGDNAPAHWNDGMDVVLDWATVDVLIIIASDDPEQLNLCNADSRLTTYLARIDAVGSGLQRLGMIRGETRVDEVGHEHFGFKDGVSQPGIRGVDVPDDPLHNPDQGNPGQDLLHPGEFVLGYPTQKAGAEILANGEPFDGPNRQEGDSSLGTLPAWAKNGSFLVFRRLAQDVKGFRTAVSSIAGSLGLTTDLMGAKLVGRYRSGAPLEVLSHQIAAEYSTPLIDPGKANPAFGNSNTINNAFEYGDDKEGDIVPLAAHIRKTYPRNQVAFQDGLPTPTPIQEKLNEANAESFNQTHRILRRGIPFGKSLGAEEGGAPDDPRGLLFFCYQSEIDRQFEFIQNAWVNNDNFPENGAGQDPIITNTSSDGAISGCPFHKSADAMKCPVTFTHFVKTRGGGYFFSPSLDTLDDMLG